MEEAPRNKLQNRVQTPYHHHHQKQPLTPTRKLSPWNGASTLYYDSYELRAVTQQLNATIKNTSVASRSSLLSPRVSPCRLKYPTRFPLWRCLDRMYEENARKGRQRRVVGCGAVNTAANHENKKSLFIPRLWSKIKRTFLITRINQA
ncbi:hypothetical protein Sjap_024038 [Stephania japonica]|uniref:Uncharacterized protein n=1 Tax=Stephania japonica TaxID=461633 RepID=A0AAP0ECP8_9MAGN